jgi:hypothetical protein
LSIFPEILAYQAGKAERLTIPNQNALPAAASAEQAKPLQAKIAGNRTLDNPTNVISISAVNLFNSDDICRIVIPTVTAILKPCELNIHHASLMPD